MKSLSRMLVSGLLVLAACAEDPGGPVATTSRPGPVTMADLIQDPAARAAQAFAMALRDPEMRRELAAHFRASSYPEGKLEFSQFRHSVRAANLVQAAASRTGRSADKFGTLLDSLAAAELYMPIRTQRLGWNGEGDVLVLGTSLTDASTKRLGLTALPAFDTSGAVRSVALDHAPRAILISLVPVETNFRLPIYNEECGPEAIIPCDPGGGGPPPTYAGWFVDEIRMVYAPWSYDGVPFGNPEFEVWLARHTGGGLFEVPLDASGFRPCASEEYGGGAAEYFNYDDTPNLFTTDFLFSHGTQAQLNAIYGDATTGGFLFIVENDDTACPNSAEPSLAEFDNTDPGNDDDFILFISLPKTSTVLDWTNPYTNDPGRIRAVYSGGRTFP